VLHTHVLYPGFKSIVVSVILQGRYPDPLYIVSTLHLPDVAQIADTHVHIIYEAVT
jgi:hypothetical protein